MSGHYAIEARSHNILGLWSHNFWVLRHPSGEVMAELHGLATDRMTQRAVAIGTSERHSLRAWHYAVRTYSGEIGVDANLVDQGPYYKDGQYSEVVIAGDFNQIMPRWRAAAKSIPFINELNIDYPPGGVKLVGRTKNSNSMFTSFGDIMGLPRVSFWQVFEPGITNPVVIDDIVDGLQAMSGEVWDQSQQQMDSPPISNHTPIKPPGHQPAPGTGHLGYGAAPAFPNASSGARVYIPFMEYTDEYGVVRRFLAE
jgi:hypothetical protein